MRKKGGNEQKKKSRNRDQIYIERQTQTTEAKRGIQTMRNTGRQIYTKTHRHINRQRKTNIDNAID